MTPVGASNGRCARAAALTMPPMQLNNAGLTHSPMANTVENGPEALNSGPSTEDRQSQSAVSNVQSQIDLLADFNKRLQTLRQLPGGVLRSELVLGSNQVLQTPTLKDIFGKSAEDLRRLHAETFESKVQDALRAAAESEQRDGSEIRDFHERESQKRWCVCLTELWLIFPPALSPPHSTFFCWAFVVGSYAELS